MFHLLFHLILHYWGGKKLGYDSSTFNPVAPHDLGFVNLSPQRGSLLGQLRGSMRISYKNLGVELGIARVF